MIAVALLSCSKKQTFKEIEINESDLKKTNIMGYGVGESSLKEIAIAKAKSKAQMNLANQISGMQFVFRKSSGSTKFKTTTSATLSNVHEVSSYCLKDSVRKKYFVVLSSPIEKKNIELDNAVFLETNFRTANFTKTLSEKYMIAVKEIAEKRYPQKTEIEGTLYLSDVKVSDYREKDDFKVEIKILVVVT